MNYRCRYLPLQEVEAGMILYRALRIAKNGVLRFSLPQDYVLTVDNLRQLSIHQAEFVPIRIEDERSEETLLEASAHEEARLRQIFANADFQQPAIAHLFNAVLAYRKS